jgi:hypothetical protein
MKTTHSHCCGSYKIKRTPIERIPLPPNPKIAKGVALIYLGAGAVKLKGEATKSIYHASDHHRHFKVYPEDLDSVLDQASIILQH